MLAMSADFADTLLGFITDSRDFLGLDIGFDHLSANLAFIKGRFADLGLFTVDEQQRLKVDRLTGLLDQLNFKRLALLDEILFGAGLDDCFFHDVHRSIAKIPAPVKSGVRLTYLLKHEIIVASKEA